MWDYVKRAGRWLLREAKHQCGIEKKSEESRLRRFGRWLKEKAL